MWLPWIKQIYMFRYKIFFFLPISLFVYKLCKQNQGIQQKKTKFVIIITSAILWTPLPVSLKVAYDSVPWLLNYDITKRPKQVFFFNFDLLWRKKGNSIWSSSQERYTPAMIFKELLDTETNSSKSNRIDGC